MRISVKRLIINVTAILIYLSPITFFVSALSRGSGKLNFFIRSIMLMYVFVSCILCGKNIINKTKNILYVPFTILTLLLLSCINNNNLNIIISQGLFLEIGQGVLLLLLIYSLEDLELFFNWMIKVGRFVQILGLATFIVSDLSESYMAYGYRMLLATIVLLHYGLYYRSKWDVLLGSLGCFAILFCGSRGAFLCSIIAIVMYMLLFTSAKHRIGFSIMLLMIGMVIYFCGDNLLNTMLNLTQNFGIYSRTLHKLLNNSISSDSHRLENFSYYWKLFNSTNFHMLFGYGMAGERYYSLKDLWYMSTYGYPHNFFVEIFLQYGLTGGTIVLIWVLDKLRSCFSHKLPINVKLFATTLLAYNMQLMISSSYLQSEFFFALIGWALWCNKYIKTSPKLEECYA